MNHESLLVSAIGNTFILFNLVITDFVSSSS